MDIFEQDWDQIVTSLGPSLFRYFRASFAEATAADAVQETLIRLVQKCRTGNFNPEKGSLAGYSYGIARFVKVELLKKRPDFSLVEDEAELEAAIADTSNEEQRRLNHLRWAIAQLNPIEQEVILMAVDNELDLSEISKSLNIPLGTVKSHIHRAKENLRRIMEVRV